jgi:hypothetical protein
VKEHPIAFSTPMMRAYLSGRKTETRRIVKPQPPAECGINYPLGNESWLSEKARTPLRQHWEAWHGECFYNRPSGHLCGGHEVRSPYGHPGDLLRIKEDLRVNGTGTTAVYAADGLPVMVDGESLDWRWKRSSLPARFMPTIACRARPPVLEVRVERLQEITEEGAKAEGVPFYVPGHGTVSDQELRSEHGLWSSGSYRDGFAFAWSEIHDKPAEFGQSWKLNQWVWVVRFEPINGKED